RGVRRRQTNGRGGLSPESPDQTTPQGLGLGCVRPAGSAIEGNRLCAALRAPRAGPRATGTRTDPIDGRPRATPPHAALSIARIRSVGMRTEGVESRGRVRG